MSARPTLLGRAGAVALLIALCSCAGSHGGGGPKADLTDGKAKAEGKAKADAKVTAMTPAVDPVKALEEARATLAKHPADPQAKFDVGFAWQRRADAEKDETARHNYLDSARVAYDSAIASDSTNVKALVHSGLVLEDLGQADDALKRYQHATEVAPTDPRPFVNLGSLLYFRYKRTYDAKVALTKALELDPNNGDAHFNLGVLFADATMFREAKVEWERVAATDSGAARTLAQQNLDKIQPMLAAQDSAESAAHTTADTAQAPAQSQAPAPTTPPPVPPKSPPAPKGQSSAPK